MIDIEKNNPGNKNKAKGTAIGNTQEGVKDEFFNIISNDPVASIVNFILDSKIISKDKTIAIFNIPSHEILKKLYISENDYYQDILPIAITRILGKFNFDIGDDLVKKIQDSKGNTFIKKFQSTLDDGLSSRTIELKLFDNKKELKITGEQPINEKDGFVNVIFDLEKYPGKLNSNDKIDFTEINSYPSVQSGAGLLEITEPGQGKTGICIDGKTIKYNHGKKCEIEIGTGVNKEFIPEENKYIYKSNTNGVVVMKYQETAGGNKEIIYINVEKSISIPEIGYKVGNIGSKEIPCYANIEVKKDIKGVFRVFIKGKMIVGGSVKGELNIDGDINANSIDSGSFVTTTGSILAEKLNDAKLISTESYIRVLKEIKKADMEAPLILMSKTTCYSNVHIKSDVIYMNNVSIKGNIIIDLGKKIFESNVDLINNIELAKKEIDKFEIQKKNIIGDLSEDLKSKVNILFNILKKSDTGKKIDPKFIDSITTNIIKSLLDFNIPLVYKWLEKLNNYCLDNRIQYNDWIPGYLTKLTKLLPLYEIKRTNEDLLKELTDKKNKIENSLDKDIIISITGSITENGNINILYGDKSFDIKILDDKKLEQVDIHMKYDLKSGTLKKIDSKQASLIIKGIIEPLLKNNN